MAVDPGTPQFSYKISDTKRGAVQTAYQVIVSEKRSPDTIIWDSGKVQSASSSGLIYGGKPLSSATPYLYKVRVWTNHGGQSEYSDTAAFRTGLSKSDWTADYIWNKTEKENDYVYFRKNFEIEKKIKDAVVYTSAHNDYQLYLNGERAGAGPARSDPYSYGQYTAYDITELLLSGENSFSALVHWHGVWSNSGVNARPAYILEAHIHYADGSREVIKTDDTWKLCPDTPYIEENPVYFGYYGGVRNRASVNYDARREIPDWNARIFDDSKWLTAAVVDRCDYNLYAQLVGGQTEMERTVPVSVTKEGDKWLVDFGRCLTGWPELKLSGNISGDKIKVQYWEVEKGWGDAGYDSYTAHGGNEMFYAPYVRHTSFRILEITGYKGELTADDVCGIVACSYAEKKGSFECSDKRLNAVYEMSERSGSQNMQQGMISVDANREQSPWTADSWNIGMGYLYNHENTMMIDKNIKDYAGEQRESGNFLTCSPAKDYLSEMAEWSLYWPMLLYGQYLFGGSRKLLSDHYHHLTKFLGYIICTKNPETGLYNPPGWRASDYAGGSLESSGENIATNSHIFRNYEIAAEVALITGNTADAKNYESMAKELKTAINNSLLVDGKKYKSSTGSSQCHPLGTAWALRFGIVPDAFRDSVVAWLASQKDTYDVGGYGGDALYNGLYSAGLGTVATADFARYDQMLSSNNTNWESFGELSIDNMGNHAWTAYPAYILQKYVGGISPTGGGFSRFEIRPVTGGLSYAKTEIPSTKGMIKTAWKIAGKEHLTLSATVPANTTAKIYVPDNDMDLVSVTEGTREVFADGTYIDGVSGLSDGKKVKGYIVFTAGSGNYNFSISGKPLGTI